MRSIIVRKAKDFLDKKTGPSEFRTEFIVLWKKLVDDGWLGRHTLSSAEQVIADEMHSVCFSFTENLELIEENPLIYLDEITFRNEIKRLLSEFLAAEPSASEL